jgi:adenylate cyclase
MGAYISKELIDEISRNREQKLALGGKTVNLTILFSDIQGFTRLSETMASQQVISFLHTYMTAMTGISEEEGGIIDKFIGDGIMAVFTPSSEDDNHALRAVRARDPHAKTAVQPAAGVGGKPSGIGWDANARWRQHW